ncbi:MAG TPA: ABC transporter ATP-binding protein [Marinobacter sp.]|nr:ABC transporter ATP-binding protein [Marinobacter sp.]
MTSLNIRHLTKSFNGQPVLQGINLDIPAGSIVALLGPSGCGKTTLLRLIGGFDRLDAGEISFDSRVVASPQSHVPPERRRIGYVPQEGTLFPHLSVTDNVAYGLSRSGRQGQRVAEILALAGLSALGNRFPHELSGGQQQRAALARALAPEPEVILLDEPFNALDLGLRRQICDDVAAMLRREGATAILVTHDPVEAFAVADLVAVMHEGRIIQVDTPDNIYWQPASEHVARLTGRPIFIDGVFQHGSVLTSLGVLPVHPNYTRAAGKASIMLRPEQITCGSNRNGAQAQVIERSFRGNHVLLTVCLQEQTLLLRSSSLSSPVPGDQVHLHVEGACAAFAA